MESLGARLKKIRLEKGLSLEEVHRQTKIHLNVLNAIEEDRLVSFNEVYIRGFLKIYCKFLGVEPKDFIPDSKKAGPKPDTLAREREKQPLTKIKTAQANPDFLRQVLGKIKILVIAVFIFLAMIFLFKAGKFIFEKARSSFKKHGSAAALPAKQESKNLFPKQQKTQKQEMIDGIRLGIRAKQDCWVRVQADGKTVFQSILRRGRYDSWKAGEKIQFSVGNAGAVEIEVNNKIIPSLGRRGQALKNILITKEGLIAVK